MVRLALNIFLAAQGNLMQRRRVDTDSRWSPLLSAPEYLVGKDRVPFLTDTSILP